MSMHTLEEARDRLGDLIDRALRGEDVVITRGDRPVVELRPVAPGAADRRRPADPGWLAAHKIPARRPSEDAGAYVSRMRDEDWR